MKYLPPNRYTASVGTAASSTAALCTPYCGVVVTVALIAMIAAVIG